MLVLTCFLRLVLLTKYTQVAEEMGNFSQTICQQKARGWKGSGSYFFFTFAPLGTRKIFLSHKKQQQQKVREGKVQLDNLFSYSCTRQRTEVWIQAKLVCKAGNGDGTRGFRRGMQHSWATFNEGALTPLDLHSSQSVPHEHSAVIPALCYLALISTVT